ncbi:MAG TPA: hypothetical protein VK745_16780 [Polyangiaceae bacterium]|nr:hypothetical protein [Polyangiaceae bacterium]
MSVRQLPSETLQDLLGIARALRVIRENHGAQRAELARIAEVTDWLVAALALSQSGPRTLPHRAAWANAERATAALIELLTLHDEVTKRLVGAWAERLRARATST